MVDRLSLKGESMDHKLEQGALTSEVAELASRSTLRIRLVLA